MANMTTVTLLFTDLVGSTELLSRIGDEAAEGCAARTSACCATRSRRGAVTRSRTWATA